MTCDSNVEKLVRLLSNFKILNTFLTLILTKHKYNYLAFNSIFLHLFAFFFIFLNSHFLFNHSVVLRYKTINMINKRIKVDVEFYFFKSTEYRMVKSFKFNSRYLHQITHIKKNQKS